MAAEASLDICGGRILKGVIPSKVQGDGNQSPPEAEQKL